MKTLCLYHGPGCADGVTSAVIVRDALGADSVDLMPVNYGDPAPNVLDRDVIMVDFSFKRPVLLEMASQAKSILILDHHESAERELVNLPENVETHFDMDKSGAMMAWEHWNRCKQPPSFVAHVQDRDLWRFDLPGTREIMAYAMSYPFVVDEWWYMVFHADIPMMREAGEHVLRAQTAQIKAHLDANTHWVQLIDDDDLTIPAINAPKAWASDAAHDLLERNPDSPCAMAYFRRQNGAWEISLRSRKGKCNVAKIAELYGGGGHACAAGYISRDAP
jgi:oligoribonuclease NrnB/cAMP/cGMP phosphodiesterase (DHH superfamily)